MIKVFKSALVLGALFFLGSCTTESLEVPEGTNLIEFYSLGVNQLVDPNAETTRAGIDIQTTQIVDGATVGIFAYQTSGTALKNAVNNPHEVAYYTTDDDQTRAKLNPTDTDKKIAWPSNDSEDPVNVRAYAPYQSANAALDALTFTVQADQSTEAGYIASDFLYASVDECKAVNGGVDLMFDHLFTKVVFYLYEGNSSVVLEGATVKLNNVATTAQINLANGTIESTSGTGDITIHTFPADQSSDYVCSAIFPAHNFAAAKFMTITDVNGKEYTVSLGNKTFAPGKVYTYGVNVKTAMEIYPTAITNWQEGHGDLNVGGGDIQSMTFMSKFAEEYAIAYYEYVDTDDDDIKDTKYGYRAKNTQAEAENDARCQHIELNYLVRPAEMATTIANASTYWNDKVKVIGFYAQALTTKSSFGYDYPLTKAFDNETFEGVIKSVTASNGILTVKVQNSNDYDLKSDFYNELISAKLALTIDIDETNFTTKYVQVFPKDSDPNIYAQKVQLNVYQASLTTGAEFQLTSTLVPSNVTTPGVVWSSSNEAIATVDQNGLVTVNDSKDGEVTITCTANMPDVNGNVVSNSCDIDVVFAEPEVYIVSNATSVEVGSTVELKYAAYPAGAYNPSILEWTSSNTALATVDDKGVVTGVAYNNVAEQDADPVYEKVTITLTADGQYVATKELTVNPVFPKYIQFTDGFGSSLQMKVGESKTFSAKVGPDNIEDRFKVINWWIKAPSAEYEANQGNGSVTDNISSYTLYASEPGTYVIHPRHASSNFYNYVYAERYVTVTHVYYDSFAFAEDAVSFKEGVTYTPVINKSVSGSLPASYTSYTLTSANTGIASISGNSIVGVAAGTTTVTATYTDVDGNVLFTDTLSVTVEQMIDRVGWYFYSDGTCTAAYNSSKTVVGIVFSNYDATTDDANLKADHPECCNGLVLALADVQTAYGPEDRTVGLNNTWQTVGYSSTKLVKESHNSGATWQIINALNSQTNYRNTSGWYIPSNQEIILLNGNRDAVNASLKVVGAGFPAMNNGVVNCYGRKYWTSTTNGNSYNYYVAWSNGLATYASGGWKSTTSYYARFVFAF